MPTINNFAVKTSKDNNAAGTGKWRTIIPADGEQEGLFQAPHAENITIPTLFKGLAEYDSDDWAVGRDYATDTTGVDASQVAVGFVAGTFSKITVYSGSIRVQDITNI